MHIDQSRPVAYRILLEMDTQIETEDEQLFKKSGLAMPQEVAERNKKYKDTYSFGTILAIGPNAADSPYLSYFKDGEKKFGTVGSRVMVAQYAGQNLIGALVGDRRLTVINDEDIFMVVD